MIPTVFPHSSLPFKSKKATAILIMPCGPSSCRSMSMACGIFRKLMSMRATVRSATA